MTVKVFLTGATGFIGGDLLFLISQHHPEREVTCIVRNRDKGRLVTNNYPRVRLVYGNNDCTDLIEEEASKADIVYHMSPKPRRSLGT